MNLTGKCKQDFENWYNEEQTYDLGNIYNGFYSRDLNMQYGVYVDWFDSVGIYVTDKLDGYNLRNEARKQYVEQANEIYNNK